MEFITAGPVARAELLRMWEAGWKVLLAAMDSFTPGDLSKTIQIRGEAHTLVDAINRQLLHVAYHVGQIVQIGKERVGGRWQSLSIPRGKSRDYNAAKGINTWSTR